MQNLQQYLFGGIALPALVCSAAFFLLRKYFSRRIEYDFAKRLAHFKYELDSAAEQSRFDYHRRLQDFNLYTCKKHEAYIELHRLLLRADGSVSGLVGVRQELTYEEFDRGDIERVLRDRQIPNGKIEEILQQWDDNPKTAVENMTEYFRVLEFQQARRAISDAQNYFWLNNLYLSDALCTEVRRTLKKLIELRAHYEYPQPTQEFPKKVEHIRSECDNLINAIIAVMKSELSVGYYANEAAKSHLPSEGADSSLAKQAGST